MRKSSITSIGHSSVVSIGSGKLSNKRMPSHPVNITPPVFISIEQLFQLKPKAIKKEEEMDFAMRKSELEKLARMYIIKLN